MSAQMHAYIKQKHISISAKELQACHEIAGALADMPGMTGALGRAGAAARPA